MLEEFFYSDFIISILIVRRSGGTFIAARPDRQDNRGISEQGRYGSLLYREQRVALHDERESSLRDEIARRNFYEDRELRVGKNDSDSSPNTFLPSFYSPFGDSLENDASFFFLVIPVDSIFITIPMRGRLYHRGCTPSTDTIPKLVHPLRSNFPLVRTKCHRYVR